MTKTLLNNKRYGIVILIVGIVILVGLIAGDPGKLELCVGLVASAANIFFGIKLIAGKAQ